MCESRESPCIIFEWVFFLADKVALSSEHFDKLASTLTRIILNWLDNYQIVLSRCFWSNWYVHSALISVHRPKIGHLIGVVYPTNWHRKKERELVRDSPNSKNKEQTFTSPKTAVAYEGIAVVGSMEEILNCDFWYPQYMWVRLGKGNGWRRKSKKKKCFSLLCECE